MYKYDNNYLYHCQVEASKMYPEMYYRIMPYINRKCEILDSEYNSIMNPFPNQEVINEMAQEIYEEYKNDEVEPETNENLTRYNGYIGPGIVTILLLGTLLGRRYNRCRGYGCCSGYGCYRGEGGYGDYRPYFGY